MIRVSPPFKGPLDHATGPGPPRGWSWFGRVTVPRVEDGPGVVFGSITCLVLLSLALAVNVYFGVVIFYAIPIGLGAWLFGRRFGFAVAVFSAVATILCALYSSHGPQTLPVSLPALMIVSAAVIGGTEWGRQNERLQRQVDASERRHREILETLTGVAKELVAAKRFESIGEHALSSLAAVLGLDAAWMFRVDPTDGRKLTLLAASGARPSRATVPRDDGLIGWVYAHGEPVRAPSADACIRINPSFGGARAEDGIEACMALPVRVRGAVFGVVFLGRFEARPWEAEEAGVATAVVDHLALAMESAGTRRAAVDAMVRLEQVNQVKSDFMKTVSHELRTPLTVVSGYVELMRDGSLGGVPSDWREPLRLVREKLNEVNHLVQLMLEAARAEGRTLSVNLEEVDLSQLVSTAVEADAAEAARLGRQLRFDPPGRSIPVIADRDKLLVVLRNLIENGTKYSPEGGVIEVGAAMTDDSARVWVADRGIGVPDAEKERIFDQFYRVDRPATRAISGTGLGLFIVRNLLELQGGKVRVEDRPGGGSIFSFVIPRDPVLVPGTRTVEPHVPERRRARQPAEAVTGR